MLESANNTTQRVDSILASFDAKPALARDQMIEIAIERMDRLARMMIRSYPTLARWEQTDDVVQEAIVRLIRALRAMKPESGRHFFNLVTVQIRRTLIDLSRRHLGPMSQAANQETDHLGEVGRAPADQTDGPQTLAEWSEFHEAVDRLPVDCQEVFSLNWYAGMTHADVARVLNVSAKTVGRRLLAAKLHLSEHCVQQVRD